MWLREALKKGQGMARRNRLRSDVTKRGPARAPHRALMYASGLSKARS